MKKEADLSGAEVTPISSTWGMEEGRGDGLKAKAEGSQPGQCVDWMRERWARECALDVVLGWEPDGDGRQSAVGSGWNGESGGERETDLASR